MKTIPTKIQRIIMLIPAVNILNLPIWFYNSFFFDKQTNTLPSTIMILCSSSIPFVALYLIVQNWIPQVTELVRYVCAYSVPLLIGYRLVRYQEKLLSSM